MKVLIADKLDQQVVDALQQSGLQVSFQPTLTKDALVAAITDFNVLVVRSTKVTQPMIEAARELSLIVRAGAGVNTIDVAKASANGIYVTNCPGKNSDAVAELTIGLLVATDRRIADATCELRDGRWKKKEFGNARGLSGRTLGILGMGAIGRAVASCALGLKMNVVAWNRSRPPEHHEEPGVTYLASPSDVAACADAVTLHLAAGPNMKHFVNSSFLSEMKDGAILLNVARGELIDTEALEVAIHEKGIRVGLDVFEDEPAGGEAEFSRIELAKLVTATPHIGASTDQAAEAVADEVVKIIEEFRATGKPPHGNVVNLCVRSDAQYSLVVRHYDQVGVLAGVLDALRDEGINVQEMENTVFEGAKAACCTLQLDESPSTGLIDKITQRPNILQVTLETRPT